MNLSSVFLLHFRLIASRWNQPAKVPPQDKENEAEKQGIDGPKHVLVLPSLYLDGIQELATEADVVPDSAQVASDLFHLLALALQVCLHTYGEILHLVGLVSNALKLELLLDESVVLMVLEVDVDVADIGAGAADFVVALLSFTHFFSYLVELFLMLGNLLPNEITLSPVLRILLTLHEIHRLDLHLLQEIRCLNVLFGILLRLQVNIEALGILEQGAHVVD